MVEEKNEPLEKTDQVKEKISFTSRLWSVVAYMWVFTFVPYFLKRRNEFVRFHAKQGVVLFIAEIIFIFISAIPIIGQIIGILGLIFCTFLSIKGIFTGLKGKKWVLPWLGRYTEKLKD